VGGYFDLCFRTYTYGENTPPTTPVINGQISGKPGENYRYDFSSTDLENDEIFYVVDWGDRFNPITYGPYDSGETVIKYYSWDEEGTFIIKVKAQDINSAESDWTTLEVTMPKAKFLWFFERFPLLQS
jgi:hypothetical protein